LAELDDAGFRELFRKTAINRTGRDRFLRNVIIAIGNSGDVALAAKAAARLRDSSPLVRGAAVWALSRLLVREAFAALAGEHRPSELDASVQDEWAAAQGATPL